MLSLLEDLLRGLAGFIEASADSPDRGSIFCPSHGDHHTRGGEAAFPFVYLGMLKGDDLATERGLDLADWLLSRQNQDGSWKETPGTWNGTTVFQLISLAGVVDVCGRDFLAERFESYAAAVKRAADWVGKNINMRRVTTNYVASGAAGLALTDRLFPGEGWDRKARRLARLAAARINGDGLVEGEGRGRRILKKIYIKPRGIDIGYGLEMTLSAMALYLVLLKDERVESLFQRALRAHLFFVYPDGALDDSLGSRGYKWTLYGSKTTHGSQMAFAYGASRDPDMKRALTLTTGCLKRYAVKGLLGNGPCRDSKTGPPCLYPTIMRSCNIALALNYFPASTGTEGLVPAEKPLWTKRFPSLNSLVVKRSPWMATVSGYGNSTSYPSPGGSRTFYVPGGGSMTCLFNEEWGHIQAATQLDYQQVEFIHVPRQPGQTATLTPGIMLGSASGTVNSAFCRRTTLTYAEEPQRTVVEVRGRFFSPAGDGLKLKSHYRIEYLFTMDRLIKHYRITLDSPSEFMEIVEPVLLIDGTVYHDLEDCLLFERGGKTLVLHGGSPGNRWSIAGNEEISCPLPSVRGLPVTYRWERPGPGEYETSITMEIKR